MSTKKSQFYVEFLGWMECRGVKGTQYVEPVIREMRRRQRRTQDTPPKLTIQASRKDLKISQDIEDKKKRFIKKIKFPTIPGRDITYVYHAPHTSPSKSSDGSRGQGDIVACIFLGYMPRTEKYVHVHVYRFDGPTTAATFYRQMLQLVESNTDRIRQVEIDLANKGEIDDPRLMSSDGLSEPHTTDSIIGSATTSSGQSDEDRGGNFSHDDIDADLQSLADVQEFDNVNDELKFKLGLKAKPLLLPPKDYDTISRAHGNLEQVNLRRCQNMSIVGGRAFYPDTPGSNSDPRPRNLSNESGVDLSSPVAADGGGGAFTDREYVQPIREMLNLSLNSEGFKSSATSSPGTPPTGMVHPKVASPPMSPRVDLLRGPQLVRQNSYNSAYSDSSRKSQHSDGGSDIIPDGAQIYTGGNGVNPDDIYAKPMKKNTNAILNNSFDASMPNMTQMNNRHNGGNNNKISFYPNMSKPTVSVSPRIDYPPADYHNEDDDIGEVKLRGIANMRNRPAILTRSMPPELIRSEMVLGGLQRNIRESGNTPRRIDSPTFAYGPGISRSRPTSGNGSHFLNSSWRPN